MTLKLEPLLKENKFLGELVKIKLAKDVGVIAFFGSRHFTWDDFPTLFPDLNIAKLKQNHGDTFVPASKMRVVEADAHWTYDLNLALTIVTADCLPIMIVDKKMERVAAIHAGWRGVDNKITQKLLRQEFAEKASDLLAVVGPHIRRDSFEVGREVWERKDFNLPSYITSHPDPEKRYLDLTNVIKDQLREFGIKEILISEHNTFTDDNFASYRRKENPVGRQISFVSLTGLRGFFSFL